jgi:undecaprenyl-diphosphatase
MALLQRTWSAVRGIEVRILLWALGAVTGLWVFAHLAHEVGEDETRRVDEALLRALRTEQDLGVPRGPAWLEHGMRDLTSLGSSPVLLLMTAVAAGWLATRRQYHAVALVLVSTVGGLLLSDALKGLFQRPRPQLVPHLVTVTSLSFPSGHAMHSAVVYLTLGALCARLLRSRAQRIYVVVAASLLTVLVGITRVYLGVHYPSDVLAGWIAGLVWALLCLLLEAYLQKRGAVEAPR